jgi:hypothetical protein
MISEQEGERTHVDSPDPETITYHYDSVFNKALLFGRPALLLLVGYWAFATRNRNGGNGVVLALGTVALALAVWLLITGWSMVYQYRIEVGRNELHLLLPAKGENRIPWEEIEGLDVEGMASDVTLFTGKGEALRWATQWKEMTLSLRGGRKIDVNLRPLSVEQRGSLWRAIVRKAGLQGEMKVLPATRRP